jgi:hypothetical protein
MLKLLESDLLKHTKAPSGGLKTGPFKATLISGRASNGDLISRHGRLSNTESS